MIKVKVMILMANFVISCTIAAIFILTLHVGVFDLKPVMPPDQMAAIRIMNPTREFPPALAPQNVVCGLTSYASIDRFGWTEVDRQRYQSPSINWSIELAALIAQWGWCPVPILGASTTLVIALLWPKDRKAPRILGCGKQHFAPIAA